MGGASKMREIIREGAYGVLPPGDSYDDTLPITFLRATEMKPNLKVDLASCHRVAREYFNPKARANIGDVLLAVKGATIASDKCVALIEENPGEAVVNGSIFRMRLKDSVSPKFAAVVLDTPLLKRQMRLGLAANNGVDYLDKSMIHSLIFPVPSTERQHEIIAIYEAAAGSHQSAIKKAKEILAGIDDYLLAELGITLPPEPENTLAGRIFTAQRQELAGWRFDPYYFGEKFHALEHGLDHASYSTASLAQLYLSINNGADCRVFIADGLPYAKVAEVKPFAVDLAQAQTVPANSIPERGLVQKGDLLLTRKGTFGVAALVETDAKFAISSEVFRIELDTSKVLGSYLVTVLNSSICQEQFDRQKIGMIMGSLTQVSLRRIRLPLPPLEKQHEIQTYASQIRKRAACFITEAQSELEAAKRRIEAMLLGAPA
jgi:type I restriction enzyme S subunit